MPSSKKQDASNTLTLAQSAVGIVAKVLSASNTLVLTGEDGLSYKINTVDQTLTIIDAAVTQNIYNLYTSNTLALSQDVSPKGTLNKSTSNVLTLTQSAESILKYSSATNTLELDHSVIVRRPYNEEASNTLLASWEELDPDELVGVDLTDPEQIAALFANKGLRHEVTVKRIINQSVTSYLSPSHFAYNTSEGTVSSHIHLAHSVRRTETGTITQILYFTHSVVASKSTPAESILDLTQTLGLEGVYPISITSELDLKNVVSFLNINFCDYSPGVGAGTFDYAAPPATISALVRRNSIVLTWPYAVPTKTIELRNPDFDNVEQFEFRRINRYSRGGSLQIYRDSNWPSAQRLIFTFSVLTDVQIADLLEFMNWTLGQEIGLLDFESRQWKGIILTPSQAISESERDGFSAGFEFEGTIQ